MSWSILRGSTSDVLAQDLAEVLLQRLIASQDTHPEVNLVLTGGTVGVKTVEALAVAPSFASVNWPDVHIWWGDERFVAVDSSDRNAVQVARFLAAVPDAQIHEMPAYDTASELSQAEQCLAGSVAYSDLMRTIAGGDKLRLDVLLLGMGPDGHVASLFPGHPDQLVGEDAIAIEDSPKPPSFRISLSLDALNHADATYLVVAGADKGDAVHACLKATEHGPLHMPEVSAAPDLGGGPLTAAFVGARGDLVWALDDAVYNAANH